MKLAYLGIAAEEDGGLGLVENHCGDVLGVALHFGVADQLFRVEESNLAHAARSRQDVGSLVALDLHCGPRDRVELLCRKRGRRGGRQYESVRGSGNTLSTSSGTPVYVDKCPPMMPRIVTPLEAFCRR